MALISRRAPSGAGEADFHRKGSQVCAGEHFIVLVLVRGVCDDASGSAAKQMMKGKRRENLVT